MKVVKTVSPNDITNVIRELQNIGVHRYCIEWEAEQNYITVKYECDYYVNVLENLNEIYNNETLSLEQKKSVNDAIGAIKTLHDMGVI